MLVLDETGFVKKGTKSVGVRAAVLRHGGQDRQLPDWRLPGVCHAAGPVLLDRALYLPESGPTIRRDGRRRACRPTRRCAPKPTLGKQLLERAFAAGVQAAWVTADSIYGGAYQLRHCLEEREQPFVLAVQSTQRRGTLRQGRARGRRLAG